MKVKVRIAVAVDSDGDWNACGWSDAPDDSTTMGIACETLGDGERRYWIEAELDAPEVATVQGKVTPA